MASRCIVMELVEGETLQERLKHGAIPLDETLPIAKQIAEALDAAHEKGITHRDLKRIESRKQRQQLCLSQPLVMLSGYGCSQPPFFSSEWPLSHSFTFAKLLPRHHRKCGWK